MKAIVDIYDRAAEEENNQARGSASAQPQLLLFVASPRRACACVRVCDSAN